MSLRKQTTMYLIIGTIQWLVDWAVMVLVSDPRSGISVEVANIAGRIAGAILGFFLNGAFTFKAEHTKVGRRQFLRFLVMWLMTTTISTFLIHWIDDEFGIAAAQRWGKPLVEFGMGIIGFVTSRYWVYHK